jgi:hypothetical protein
MVREEYFTSLANLGSGKVESFTTKLTSRVCLVKTLKTPKCMGSLAKARHQNDKLLNERIDAPISLLSPMFNFSLQVTFTLFYYFLIKSLY